MTIQQSTSAYADPAAVEAFKERFDAIHANVSRAIMGKPGEIQLALTCMLAEGHLLVDDVPGTGKTTLAKAIAASLGSSFHRIQFTPDLLPTDVTGSMIYNAKDGDFTFHPGGVFANVVLADEINRASPKTQSALLEVMEERQVTVDSVMRPVPRPFVVIATQNPVEFDGTYHLPEAQIDRFMMRMAMGYPSHEAEVECAHQFTPHMATVLRPSGPLAPSRRAAGASCVGQGAASPTSSTSSGRASVSASQVACSCSMACATSLPARRDEMARQCPSSSRLRQRRPLSTTANEWRPWNCRR